MRRLLASLLLVLVHGACGDGAQNPKPTPPAPRPDAAPESPAKPTRLGSLTLRHDAEARDVAISPDGKVLASAGRDELIRLWSADDGRELRVLSGHKNNVSGVGFADGGKTIISAGADRTIRLWDAATGKERARFDAPSAVYRFALSPDGAWLAASGTGGATVFDVRGGKPVVDSASPAFSSAAFSPDGKLLATTVLGAPAVSVTDAATGRALRQIADPEQKDFSVSVAFSPDGKQLVVGGADKTIRVFDAETGKLARKLAGAKGSVTAVAVSPDGKWLASGEYARTVRLWELATGKLVHTMTGDAPYSTWRLAFTPDSARVFAVGGDHAIYAWSVTGGARTLASDGHTNAVTGVVWFPDGARVASSSSDGSVRIWDVAAQKSVTTLRVGPYVTTLAMSPDGTMLALAEEQRIHVWVAGKEELRVLEGHTKPVHALVFLPDGKLVSGGEDAQILVWDPAAGKKERTLEGQPEGVGSLAVSADGKLLAAATAGGPTSRNGTLRVWDLATGQLRPVLDGHANWATAVGFSDDARWLASTGWDQTLQLWDVAAGKSIGIVAVSSYSIVARALAFEPKGGRLAFADGWNGVRLYAAPSLRMKLTFRDDRHASSSVAFSHDGQSLASGGWGGDVLVWKLTP